MLVQGRGEGLTLGRKALKEVGDEGWGMGWALREQGREDGAAVAPMPQYL